MNLGTAYVQVKADRDPLRAGLNKAENDVSGSVGRMNKATSGITFKGAMLAASAFGATVGLAMYKAVNAASNLQETQNKFDVVFRNQMQLAESWSDVLQAGYVMSERESKSYLASVQDLLVPMGMASDEAGKLSFEVVKLAADLGSFNNLSTAQVMGDIQSAMVGNYETMKKYGVVLSATVVQEKALEMGLADAKDQLTAADKAMAAYRLTVLGSEAAIGDMARSTDSYAYSVKKFRAEWEDFLATSGEVILPLAAFAMENLATAVKFYADKIGVANKETDKATTSFTGLISSAEGYDGYLESIAKKQEKIAAGAYNFVDNWTGAYGVVAESVDGWKQVAADASWSIEEMTDKTAIKVADNWEKMSDKGVDSWKDVEKQSTFSAKQMTTGWENFYDMTTRKGRGAFVDTARAGESFTDGLKAGLIECQGEMDTLGDVGADVAGDIRDAMSDAVRDMVDDFIRGMDDMSTGAEVASELIVNSLGNFSSKLYDKAIDAMIDLISVNLGLGAAESSSYSAGWGGFPAAAADIGAYLSLATAAMLAGRGIANSTKAEGGWVSQHPNGGFINQGSGTADDVFLGSTGNVRHWGMGGEFVMNKRASEKFAPMLESMNRNYGDGGPIIPWEGAANSMAAGGGASFMHGFYKGGGPISGLAEMGLFFAKIIPTAFIAKTIGDMAHANGGWLDVGHGLIPGVNLGPIDDISESIAAPIEGLTGLPIDPGNVWEWMKNRYEYFTDPDKLMALMMDMIHAPLEQVSKDLVTPGVYYSDPLDVISDIIGNMKDIIKEMTGTDDIPFLDKGTDFFPRDGLAYLHKGEKVVPADENKREKVPIELKVIIDGREIGYVVADQTTKNIEMVDALRKL